jgi:hypothetical protein
MDAQIEKAPPVRSAKVRPHHLLLSAAVALAACTPDRTPVPPIVQIGDHKVSISQHSLGVDPNSTNNYAAFALDCLRDIVEDIVDFPQKDLRVSIILRDRGPGGTSFDYATADTVSVGLSLSKDLSPGGVCHETAHAVQNALLGDNMATAFGGDDRYIEGQAQAVMQLVSPEDAQQDFPLTRFGNNAYSDIAAVSTFYGFGGDMNPQAANDIQNFLYDMSAANYAKLLSERFEHPEKGLAQIMLATTQNTDDLVGTLAQAVGYTSTVNFTEAYPYFSEAEYRDRLFTAINSKNGNLEVFSFGYNPQGQKIGIEGKATISYGGNTFTINVESGRASFSRGDLPRNEDITITFNGMTDIIPAETQP